MLAFCWLVFCWLVFCWVGFGLRIFTKLSLGWVGFLLLLGWLWAAGLALGCWVDFGLAGFGFLPIQVGILLGWLWASLAGLNGFGSGWFFRWVGFGLWNFTKLSPGWVGFLLFLGWLWAGWLWLFAKLVFC